VHVLGLVPARGGSKGVPGKNGRDLLGRPLLAWTADSARRAELLDDVVLSTDDEALAALGASLGLEVPFLRPAELAADDTPMLAVVQHAVATLAEAGRTYDAVCLLQPTSPARPEGLVDTCLVRLADPERPCSSVVTMVPVAAEHHPDWAWVDAPDGGVALAAGGADPVARRQDLRPAYRRDGSVYVVRTEVLAEGSLYGGRVAAVLTDPASAVSIDEPEDWARAEDALRLLDGQQHRSGWRREP
jgi:CMP-N,N'-diacetyllegionaminic acid synthase